MAAPIFQENQRFRQVWIWLIVLAISVLGWWAFYVQILTGEPFGSRPGPDWMVWLIFLCFGLGFPLLFVVLKLVTEVGPDYLRVSLRPFHSRTIPLGEIVSAEVRQYRPIREYGGWGIRWSPKYGRAYNISGNMGVQLTLSDGGKVLIGSQRSEELARGINGARSE